MEEIIISNQGSVKCDFEAIKQRLNDQLEIYSNMVFTEDAKKDAKDTVAELRKEKKAFQDRVKEVKKEWMKPFDDFYAKASEISDLYDKPIYFIGEQIEAFEQARINEKKETIKEIYAEIIPEEEWQEVLPLQKIWNPKWENATFTAKQIKDELMERKSNAKMAIQTIKSMNCDKEAEVIRHYKDTFDLSFCLSFITSYEAQKKEILAQQEERLRREAEERIRAEERAKIEAEAKIIQAKEEAIAELIPEEKGEPETEYSYIITMTASAKEKLELYMNSIGITFEELP